MNQQQGLRERAKDVVQAGLDFLKIVDFETEDLIEGFSSTEANAPSTRNHITECIVPLREALEEQCDIIFGLIGVKIFGLIGVKTVAASSRD